MTNLLPDMNTDPALLLNLGLGVLALIMSAKLAFQLKPDIIGTAWKSSVMVAVLYVILKGGQVVGDAPTQIVELLLALTVCASLIFHRKVLAGVGSDGGSV